jgi:hypothetical protein
LSLYVAPMLQCGRLQTLAMHWMWKWLWDNGISRVTTCAWNLLPAHKMALSILRRLSLKFSFSVLLFTFFFCFALLSYLCALFCALLCCVFMFHCIMYYLLCNLIAHAWYLWTCMCYLCLYVNVLYVFM